jgi:hypothetical protein
MNEGGLQKQTCNEVQKKWRKCTSPDGPPRLYLVWPEAKAVNTRVFRAYFSAGRFRRPS